MVRQVNLVESHTIRIKSSCSSLLWSLPAAVDWAVSVSAACSCMVSGELAERRPHERTHAHSCSLLQLASRQTDSRARSSGESLKIACKSKITLPLCCLYHCHFYCPHFHYTAARASERAATTTTTTTSTSTWEQINQREMNGQVASCNDLESKILSSNSSKPPLILVSFLRNWFQVGWKRICEQHWVASLTVQERQA